MHGSNGYAEKRPRNSTSSEVSRAMDVPSTLPSRSSPNSSKSNDDPLADPCCCTPACGVWSRESGLRGGDRARLPPPPQPPAPPLSPLKASCALSPPRGDVSRGEPTDENCWDAAAREASCLRPPCSALERGAACSKARGRSESGAKPGGWDPVEPFENPLDGRCGWPPTTPLLLVTMVAKGSPSSRKSRPSSSSSPSPPERPPKPKHPACSAAAPARGDARVGVRRPKKSSPLFRGCRLRLVPPPPPPPLLPPLLPPPHPIQGAVAVANAFP
jgi:hypothetical protein